MSTDASMGELISEEVRKGANPASVTTSCKKEGDKLLLTASKAEVTK